MVSLPPTFKICVVHGAGEGTLPVHRFDSYGALKSIPVVIEGSNKTDSWFEYTATLWCQTFVHLALLSTPQRNAVKSRRKARAD